MCVCVHGYVTVCVCVPRACRIREQKKNPEKIIVLILLVLHARAVRETKWTG